MDGYSSPEMALACGMMLRECIRFEGKPELIAAASIDAELTSGRGGGGGGGGSSSSSAAAAPAPAAAGGGGSSSRAGGAGAGPAGAASASGYFLHETVLIGADGGLSQPLRHLFEEHVHNPNFEVSADAFETLTTLLTTNKAGVLALFNPQGDAATRTRFDELFGLYNQLLLSDNYVLKRQSLRLLGEFLLDRDNFAIMMQYISDRGNLKVIMGMLRHRQPNIQFEAFHVFKVFVANPEKPADIAEILAANRDKLVAFLRAFLPGKDDAQFAEEKAMLIETLLKMQPPPAAPVAAAAAPVAAAAAAAAVAPATAAAVAAAPAAAAAAPAAAAASSAFDASGAGSALPQSAAFPSAMPAAPEDLLPLPAAAAGAPAPSAVQSLPGSVLTASSATTPARPSA